MSSENVSIHVVRVIEGRDRAKPMRPPAFLCRVLCKNLLQLYLVVLRLGLLYQS